MKKTVSSGAIFSLLLTLILLAHPGEIFAGSQNNVGDSPVERSAATHWRQAFPEATAAGVGFSGAKNMNDNFNFAKKPQKSLLGAWVCHTQNGDVSLNFLSENQLNFNGDTAYYTSTSTEITVQADGETITYPYVFNDKGLLITFPQGVKALFVRSRASASAAQGKIFPQLIGEWKDIRSSGNTVITLGADGRYAYYSDFAAGNSNAGETNWGTANSNSDRGTWRAQGTARAGTIFYKSADGSSDTLTYQVHVENGRTYWGEYYFDGTIYVKQ